MSLHSRERARQEIQRISSLDVEERAYMTQLTQAELPTALLQHSMLRYLQLLIVISLLQI